MVEQLVVKQIGSHIYIGSYIYKGSYIPRFYYPTRTSAPWPYRKKGRVRPREFGTTVRMGEREIVSGSKRKEYKLRPAGIRDEVSLIHPSIYWSIFLLVSHDKRIPAVFYNMPSSFPFLTDAHVPMNKLSCRPWGMRVSISTQRVQMSNEIKENEHTKKQ